MCSAENYISLQDMFQTGSTLIAKLATIGKGKSICNALFATNPCVSKWRGIHEACIVPGFLEQIDPMQSQQSKHQMDFSAL